MIFVESPFNIALSFQEENKGKGKRLKNIFIYLYIHFISFHFISFHFTGTVVGTVVGTYMGTLMGTTNSLMI